MYRIVNLIALASLLICCSRGHAGEGQEPGPLNELPPREPFSIAVQCDGKPAEIKDTVHYHLCPGYDENHKAKDLPQQGAPQGKEPKRLTTKEAEELLQAASLVDMTTDAIWSKLKVQVFKNKYSEAMPNHKAFVIKHGAVIPIGKDFGGNGVNSVCVADLRGNGQPYLVFSYAWGSGIHRSQIGALDCLAKEPKEITAIQSLVLDFKHDWSVRALDDKTVRVEGGGVNFGNLALEEKEGITVLSIRLRDDLPAEIKKKVQ